MACCQLATPGRALVSLNEGREKIFLTGTVSYGWDSNVFVNKESGGDYVMSASLSSEYTRRAGIIGVDATLGVNAARFNQFTTEDFDNPTMSVSFKKDTGRTTGSLALRAQRESRADTAANLRNDSWNYSAQLSLRYPVIERYSLSGDFTAARRDFAQNEILVDLDTLAANVDLFYMLSSDRDLFAGYRWRREQTTADLLNIDHAFTIGLSGKITPKLKGNIRAGLQTRKSEGAAIADDHSSWTAGVALTWTATKRVNVMAQLSKDFTTTSLNQSTDSLVFGMDANYQSNSLWDVSAGLGYGKSSYFGIFSDGRSDDFYRHQLSVNLTFNDKLKVSASYGYFINWSTISYADFRRNQYTLSANSRW